MASPAAFVFAAMTIIGLIAKRAILAGSWLAPLIQATGSASTAYPT
jgi:hypothetical protein